MDGAGFAPYIERQRTGLMRLFLYLVALLAGFSPAQANRAILAEPIAVGAVSQPKAAIAAAPSRQPLVHQAFLASPGHLPPAHGGVRLSAAPSAPTAPVELTDRPRA